MINKNIKKSASENLKIKEEIADKYIQKFKEELWWIKSLAIIPIEKKLKNIMLSWEKLKWKKFEDLDNLWLWRKILWFITPQMSIDIFDFIKEKQESIVKAETSDQLNNLMVEIISDNNQTISNNEKNSENIKQNNEEEDNKNTKIEDDSQKITPVVWASAAVAWYAVAGKYASKLNEVMTLKSNPSLAKIKKSYNDVIETLQEQMKNPKLLTDQKNNIQKSIKEFEYARDNTSQLKSSLKDIDSLGKKWIMWIEDISKIVFWKSEIKILDNLTKDKKLLKTLSSIKDEKQISDILQSKWLNKSSKDLIKIISKVDNVEDMGAVFRVASKVKTVSRIAKVLKTVPFIDAIGFGVDVMVYIDESNEADLIKKTNKLRWENKQSSAYLHLATWWASAIAWLTALAVATPPVGWIALWVVAAWASVNEVMDTYYFNVVDFYTQNKEDYKNQYRTELKSAIYQSTIHGENTIDNSFSDKFASIFNFSNSIEDSNGITLKDAYWTIIFQEETSLWEYTNVLSINPEFPNTAKKEKLPQNKEDLKNYKQDRKKLKHQIDTRIKYISNFLPENNKNNSNKKYDEFIKNIESVNGINYIEKIIAESKVYSSMKNTKDNDLKWSENIQDYKIKLKNSLLKSDKLLFNKLLKIYKDDKISFIEMYNNVKLFKTNYLDGFNNSNISIENKKALQNAEFIIKFYNYKFGDLPLELQTNMDYVRQDIDYVDIKDFLVNIEARNIIKPYKFTKKEAISQMQSLNTNERLTKIDIQVSDSVWQNIVYEIAKQIHGYVWWNNQLELMNFFKEDKWDVLGIYYTNWWKLNINNQIDNVSFDLNDFETRSAKLMTDHLFTYRDSKTGKKIKRQEILNTATDNWDDWLNDAYINDVSSIINQEKLYTTKKYKEQTEDNISKYISDNSQWNYIELPYSLITKWLKTQIWDLRYYMFKYENNKIVATTRWDLIHNTLNFNKYNLKYEKIWKTREKLTDIENKLILNVDQAHDKLEELRSVSWSNLSWWTKQDDLDIPKELEKTISKKRKKRQDIKNSLYYTSVIVSETSLKSSYEQYLNYFDWLYIWLLSMVNNSSLSNDVDNIDYFNQSLMFTKWWLLSLDKEKWVSIPESVLNKNQIQAFYTLLNEIPDKENKSILYFLKSKNKQDQQKWLWFAKQLLRSILESSNLSFDQKTGSIKDIKSPLSTISKKYSWVLSLWWLWVLISSGIYNKQEVVMLQKRLNINLSKEYKDSAALIEKLDIKNEDIKQSNIAKVEQKDVESYTNISEIEQEIISTQDDIDWEGKRWRIEKNGDMIKSRWVSTKIDRLKTWLYKIDTLNIFIKNEKEVIRIANLINKIKWDLLKSNQTYKWTFQWNSWWDLEVNNWYIFDTNILDDDTIEDKYPTIYKSTRFLNYINSL